MPSVFVSLEGTNLAHRYVVREISLYFCDEQSVRHYFVEKPADLHLSIIDKRTDSFVKNQLGGIPVNTYIPGSIDTTAMTRLILSLANMKILCVGAVAMRYLGRMLPYANIQDLQTISDFKYESELPSADCGHTHNPRYCSLAKLIAVCEFMNTLHFVF